MKRLQVGLLLVIALAWTTPVQAQLFGRKPAPNPSQRVPELILTVKTDPEERKRAHAAEELREYDATTFTEIVPVLVDVLKQEKKPGVRMEALNSLVKIRPVQPIALAALEKAAAEDDSWRVRWQAKTALTKMQLTGLGTKKTEPASVASKKKTTTTTEEPPTISSTPAAPNTFTVEVMPPGNNTAPRPLPGGGSAPAPLPPSMQPAPIVPTSRAPSAPTTPTPLQGPNLFP